MRYFAQVGARDHLYSAQTCSVCSYLLKKQEPTREWLITHIDITQTLKYTIHRKPGFPCMEQPDNFPVFIKWEFHREFLVSFPGMEHYT